MQGSTHLIEYSETLKLLIRRISLTLAKKKMETAMILNNEKANSIKMDAYIILKPTTKYLGMIINDKWRDICISIEKQLVPLRNLQ